VVRAATLRGHAGGLAVGFGALWATMPSGGRVERLDPRTGRVIDEIPVGSGPGAIAVGGGGVWVANALDATVSLIDPERDAVVLTRQVRGTPTAMAAVGRRVWVAAADASALTRLAPDEPTRVVPLPSAATAMTTEGGTVLAALGLDRASHRGGTLRVRSSVRLTTPDTHICCNIPPALRNASYEALLGISVAPGAVGTLVPNLALAVPRPQDGGRTYTFHLRADLRYWTGRRVRASDFRRGLEVAVRGSSLLASYLGALPGVRRCVRGGRCDLRAAVRTDDDAGTVTLHLTRQDPDLLWAMALSYFAPAPVDHGPIPGTGPYRIQRLAPERLIDLRRNPYFHERAPAASPDGYPDRIVVQIGNEPDRSVADVIAGRADFTDDQPSPAQIENLRINSPDRLHADPVAGDAYASLNTRAKPFDDIRVRRALALAVDRGALARRWGPGVRPLCQIVPAAIPGHAPYCPYTRRPNKAGTWSAPDIGKARALIAASGTKGTAITYWAKLDAGDKPGLVDSYIASLLRRLGYKVTLRVIRPHTELGSDFQIASGSWWADIPSPSQWMDLLSCDTFDDNPARFCDPVADRWARQAKLLQSSNPAAADRLWARVDRRITDQAPWIPAVQPAWISVVSARVGGYQYVPTIGPLLHRLWVR
jgi:ABC-type transport system substrate-binding protein